MDCFFFALKYVRSGIKCGSLLRKLNGIGRQTRVRGLAAGPLLGGNRVAAAFSLVCWILTNVFFCLNLYQL